MAAEESIVVAQLERRHGQRVRQTDRCKGNRMSETLANPSTHQLSYQSDIVHCIMLEGNYFWTLYQLHSTQALVGFATKLDPISPEALQAMLDMRSAPCYEDAIRLLRLTVLLPQGNLSTTW
jgi:hypothetical protein